MIGGNLLNQIIVLQWSFLFNNTNTVNPFPSKPWFLRVCITSLMKTMWEKEKLLVTSNFSFSHSVFYQSGELYAIFIKFKIVSCNLFQFGIVQNLSFGKGLNHVGSCETQGRHLNKLGRGPLGHAAYQISKPSSFREKEF